MYVLICLIYLSSFISSISCTGTSPTFVDPNNPLIPRTQDFKECSEPISCDGLYYCGNGASCYVRSCRACTHARGICFPDYTFVPSCVETYQVSLTVAIIIEESPINVMRSVADACGVTSQMVILNIATSSKTVVDIIKTISPHDTWMAQYYTAYDIKLGFFYEAAPDQPIYAVTGKFRQQLLWDSASLLDQTASAFSIGRQAAVLVNTSNIQIIPTTFAIQRCSDGTAVTGEEKCPPIDPALVPNAAAASTSTSSTTRLLTIILPIIGGIVLITLIIAAVVIVRRRHANKAEQQTEKHTEPAVEVAMA